MVQHLKFHRSVDDMVPINERRPWLYFIKQIRVVADLLELHQNIQKLDPVL